MIKKLVPIVVVPTAVFLFQGCSGCSEEEIPTISDSDRKSLKLSEIPKEQHKRDIANHHQENYTEHELLPFPTFPGQKIPGAEEEIEADSDIETEEKSQKIDNEMEQSTTEEKEDKGERPSKEEKMKQYQEYEEKLKEEMKKAMQFYPRPPSPASLNPYDDIDEGSYRKPTKEEIQNGVGDFPPVPPAMYLKI